MMTDYLGTAVHWFLERTLQEPEPIEELGTESAVRAAEEIQTEETFTFLALPELWILGLVVLPLLILFVRWSYGGLSRLEPGTRTLLATLRALAIAFALFLLFQPAIERKRYTEERSQIHVLVDDSASMQRKDIYPDAEQRAALSAAAAGPIEGKDRADLVRQVLGKKGGLLDTLNEDYELRLFRFVRKPQPIQSLDELTRSGERSPIGDALDLHLQTAGAVDLSSVVLVSDGRNNDGASPQEIARKYHARDLPIFTVGVGDPTPPKNIRLIGPPGPREGLKGEELLFEVTLDAEGLEGRQVVVTLEASLEGGPFLPIATETATLLGDHVPSKVRLTNAFEDPGDYSLKFRVDKLPEETAEDDNEAIRFLRIEDQQIRVLLLDDAPRWEYRYLHTALNRVDESIQFQAFLFDASRTFPQEASDELPPLTDIPRTREELFEYHVILIGDVPPERISPTEEGQEEWLELLVDFVEFGGGLGCMFGERAMPERYRNTPLQDLLPVVLESETALRQNPVPRDESGLFNLQLDNPSVSHEIVRLLPDPDLNRRLWERGFAPFQLYYPVQNVKAGATPLLRHSTRGNRYGKHVIAAVGSYPRGRTFFLGTDESWRMRSPYGETYHDRFWRNIVRTLASGRLARRDDRVELRLDRVTIDKGDQVEVTLLARDEEFQPLILDEHPVFLRRADGSPERRVLRPLPTEPGTYRARFTLDDPGSYSFLVYENDNPGDEVLAREDVLVEIPDRELADSSQDRETLKQVADASGDGRYVFLADVDELAEDLAERRLVQRQLDTSTRTIWDQSWVLFVLLGLLGVEWILRKRARLV